MKNHNWLNSRFNSGALLVSIILHNLMGVFVCSNILLFFNRISCDVVIIILKSSDYHYFFSYGRTPSFFINSKNDLSSMSVVTTSTWQ